MPTKKVTMQEIIDAAEANGYKHFRGGFYKQKPIYRQDGPYMVVDDGPIIGACILGQAAINLGVEEGDIVNSLNELGRMDIKFSMEPKVYPAELVNEGVGDAIMDLNDYTRTSYKSMVKKLRKAALGREKEKFTLKTKEFNAIKLGANDGN